MQTSRQRTPRLKQRAALEFVKALEARGVRFVDGDRPVSVDELADALGANYTE
ncbi:hypothetical protein [Rhodococcus sp. 05-2254-6]|uniref:hypothetical protein n=1 Tax=Rhodococcus sp. 05-2254-6 TaxID=2022489 RepID=UPI00211B3E0A|nr:hypothetical protein [Rhodococcus sp. 05-2254-6]